jgi:hypothetical protein
VSPKVELNKTQEKPKKHRECETKGLLKFILNQKFRESESNGILKLKSKEKQFSEDK